MIKQQYNSAAAQELRLAFDQMMDSFNAVREAIDTPELFPVPESDRGLAEGYRYLLGFMLGNIERSLNDPLYPQFKRAIQPMNRSTIDNADAVYLCAEIDGNHSYVIKGRGQDCRHWQGVINDSERRAPQYVIFELSSGYSGDSGELSELRPGTRINTSTLDSSSLQVEYDGSFEILVAPEKPLGYSGNFMLSRRESRGTEYVGRFINLREIFHDWEREELLELEILRVGGEQEPPAPISPESAAQMMRQCGELTNAHMRFWNAFYAITLETYGKVEGGVDNGSGEPFMPTNGMNPPNALGIATGGGQSTNVYSGGVFKLKDNEALLIEARIPVEPLYCGFHLSNLWGESLDFQNHQSSLNVVQMFVGEDGVHQWLVAHKDPGIQNWLDTTGIEHGYLTMRCTYAEKPPRQNWPSLEVKKFPLDQIDQHISEKMPRINAQERAEEIKKRQRHVQRRYRQY